MCEKSTVNMENFCSGFHLGVVSNPDNLYEWNIENGKLDIMIHNIEHGVSFLLYGERRSGKTSLLQCMQSRIYQTRQNIFCVIIDFQEYPNFKHMGASRGYFHIVRSIARASVDERKNGKILFSDDFMLLGKYSIYELANTKIEMESDDCCAIFGEMDSILKETKKTLVLLFDEYQYLGDVFSDNESFFSYFRTLQAKYDVCSGGIVSILAGSEDIGEFYERTGSPQFNEISERIYVEPLRFSYFSKLWNDCREKSSPFCRKNLDSHETDLEKIYDLCGGRPAFAKRLGYTWSRSENIKENPLDMWLKNIYEGQSEHAKSILRDIAMDRPVTFCDEIRRLQDLCLVKKDEELGEFVINGILFRQFLCKCDEVFCRECEFHNAGDLAERIVEKGKIPHLLKMLGNSGEHDDWLEFKHTLDPTQKQLEEAKEKKEGKGDFTWNVLKAILSMRNTRGGLILLGVDDDGKVVGLSKGEIRGGLSDADFVKRIAEKLSHEKIALGSGKTVSLEQCDWHFSDIGSQWIDFRDVIIDDKLVVAIIVRPVDDISKNAQWVVEINPDNSEKTYMPVRKKKVSTEKILRREKEKIERYVDEMRKLNPNDLESFWKKLSNI